MGRPMHRRAMSEAAAIEVPRDRDDEYRVRRGTVRILSIHRHRFMMVDGMERRSPRRFEARVPALYATVYVRVAS